MNKVCEIIEVKNLNLPQRILFRLGRCPACKAFDVDKWGSSRVICYCCGREFILNGDHHD